MSSVKLDGFRSQLETSSVSSHPENTTVFVLRPTKWTSVAQGLFKVGPGAGP